MAPSVRQQAAMLFSALTRVLETIFGQCVVRENRGRMEEDSIPHSSFHHLYTC